MCLLLLGTVWHGCPYFFFAKFEEFHRYFYKLKFKDVSDVATKIQNFGPWRKNCKVIGEPKKWDLFFYDQLLQSELYARQLSRIFIFCF